ncbi:hypothetical protein GCA48_20480 [Salmonella enterica]|nr:hypothetical protein [Salmonella enterica]
MNNDELVTRRAQAIAEDRCFLKGRLRDEFRMKPAPGAEPVKWYKNTYGDRFINRNSPPPKRLKKHPKTDVNSTPPVCLNIDDCQSDVSR